MEKEGHMDINIGPFLGYILDGKGGGQKIGWEGLRNWSPEQGILWVLMDYKNPENISWILDESGLDRISCEALLAEETRPRSLITHEGLLIALRGVNLHPESDPEDMVSIRLWINHDRIISTHRRKLLSADDLESDLKQGIGPKTTGMFLVDMTKYLMERMADVVNEIEDRVDYLQDQILTLESYELRTQLSGIRRQAIGLRRYLGPQRDAMMRLYNERVPWIEEIDRIQLREITDQTMRYVEDLDSARDRAAVTQEELMNRLSEQLNKRMYVLSIVTAIFLPLSFLTGLLGINVGGIPGAEYKLAFYVVCLFLGLVVGFQFLLFKKNKWL
jgi:zinc transporter